jgi:hypothetical protein
MHTPHPAGAASGRRRSDLLHSGLHRRAPMERRAGRGRRRCSDLLRSGLRCRALMVLRAGRGRRGLRRSAPIAGLLA